MNNIPIPSHLCGKASLERDTHDAEVYWTGEAHRHKLGLTLRLSTGQACGHTVSGVGTPYTNLPAPSSSTSRRLRRTDAACRTAWHPGSAPRKLCTAVQEGWPCLAQRPGAPCIQGRGNDFLGFQFTICRACASDKPSHVCLYPRHLRVGIDWCQSQFIREELAMRQPQHPAHSTASRTLTTNAHTPTHRAGLGLRSVVIAPYNNDVGR